MNTLYSVILVAGLMLSGCLGELTSDPGDKADASSVEDAQQDVDAMTDSMDLNDPQGAGDPMESDDPVDDPVDDPMDDPVVADDPMDDPDTLDAEVGLDCPVKGPPQGEFAFEDLPFVEPGFLVSGVLTSCLPQEGDFRDHPLDRILFDIGVGHASGYIAFIEVTNSTDTEYTVLGVSIAAHPETGGGLDGMEPWSFGRDARSCVLDDSGVTGFCMATSTEGFVSVDNVYKLSPMAGSGTLNFPLFGDALDYLRTEVEPLGACGQPLFPETRLRWTMRLEIGLIVENMNRRPLRTPPYSILVDLCVGCLVEHPEEVVYCNEDEALTCALPEDEEPSIETTCVSLGGEQALNCRDCHNIMQARVLDDPGFQPFADLAIAHICEAIPPGLEACP